jgi:hypothetical protein
MPKKIPEQVTTALLAWHAVAVEFENHPSEEVSARACAAWTAFEEECLKWQRNMRSGQLVGIFGPTGTGMA